MLSVKNYPAIFPTVSTGNWGINGKGNQQNCPHLVNSADTPKKPDVPKESKREAGRWARSGAALTDADPGDRRASETAPPPQHPSLGPFQGASNRGRPEGGGISGLGGANTGRAGNTY